MIRHEVLFYGDRGEFLAGTVPFLREGLVAGEPALVAVTRKQAKELRGELGADADGVRFAPMEEMGRNPARIIPFWRDFLEEHGGRGRPLRGIGEPVWPGRSAAELEECHRHEGLLNLAFSGKPPWSLLCPYDSSSLEDDVLEAAERCHPFVVRGGRSEPNASFADAPSRTAGPFAGILPPRPPIAEELEFDRAALAEVRARVAVAGRALLSPSRASDLVTAASELAANSVVHGGGRGTIAIWRDGGELLVDVEDRGTIDEPLLGRRRPLPTQEGGRGVWIANQLCDLVQIRSGAAGTTVRLRMSLSR